MNTEQLKTAQQILEKHSPIFNPLYYSIDPMKETEQTLFLKSNLLHIRLKQGEFEVSNPETAGIMQNGKFFLWHTDSNGGYKHTESEGVDCEWPGKVELIKQRGAINLTVARLLPEEKKSESAYKEGEKRDYNKLRQELRNLLDSETDKSLIKWLSENKEPVSAPSESQEDEYGGSLTKEDILKIERIVREKLSFVKEDIESIQQDVSVLKTAINDLKTRNP